MKLVLVFLLFVTFGHIEPGPVPLTFIEPWSPYPYRPLPPSFARQLEYDDDEEDGDDEENEEEEDDDADDDAHGQVYPESSSNVFPKFDGTEKDPTTINEYQKHFPTSFTKRAGKPNRSKANKKSKPKPVPPPPSSASDESVEDYGNVPWMRERKISSSASAMGDFHGPIMRRPPGGGFYPQRRRISSHGNLMNARSSVNGGGLFSRRVIPGIIPDQGIKVYYYNNGYGRGRGFY